MQPIGYAEALSRRPLKSNLSHIDVTHHMLSGPPVIARVEPGKMAEHIADCPHCGGQGEP